MIKLVICLLVFLVSGCATVTHMNELLTLKSISSNQADIERYLKKQEKGFNLLKDDIKNNRLKKGKLKAAVIAKYYEPVLIEKSEDGVSDIFLYRHPTEYFKSDRLYLHFDAKGKLASWELKPAE